jgi:hypothetical protein
LRPSTTITHLLYTRDPLINNLLVSRAEVRAGKVFLDERHSVDIAEQIRNSVVKVGVNEARGIQIMYLVGDREHGRRCELVGADVRKMRAKARSQNTISPWELGVV